MLLFAQFLSWQFLLPLWVMLFILTSRPARPAPTTSRLNLVVDLWDIAVLPLSVLFTLVLPTVAMYLPPSKISAKGHYASMAFWQLFPLWHYLLHSMLSTLGRSRSVSASTKPSKGDFTAYLSRVKGVYDLVFYAGTIGQLPILLLTLAPNAVLSSLAEALPGFKPYFASSASLSSIYTPWLPWDAPTVDPKTIESGDLAPLAIFFLHYDIYIGCSALLLWAIYMHRHDVTTHSFGRLVVKTAVWFSVGGFSSSVAALLWERDHYVLEESEKSGKKNT